MNRDKTLLVVDDNPTNLKLVLAVLSREPYEVRTATDARQALALLETFVPSVVLLDIQLPDIDGLVLARKLRADVRTQRVPLIAVTAYAMKGDEERALDAGFDAYLTKPIDKAALRELVRRYMGGGAGAAPSNAT